MVRGYSTVAVLLVAMAKALLTTHATQHHWGKNTAVAERASQTRTQYMDKYGACRWVGRGYDIRKRGRWVLSIICRNLELALRKRLSANPFLFADKVILYFSQAFSSQALSQAFSSSHSLILRNNCYSPFYLHLGYCRLKDLMNNLHGILNGVFNRLRQNSNLHSNALNLT